jgi:hypothetical protein
MGLTLSLTILTKIRYALTSTSDMRRKKTEDGQNWREWLESRPLVVLVGAAIAVSSTTLGVAKYFFDQEKNISEKSHSAELQQVKMDHEAKIKELQGRLLSIERHIGTETIWDVSKVLVSPSQVRGLGGDFTYFDDLQCYLAVPTSGTWIFKQTNELELTGMILGAKWASEQLATAGGKLMSGMKVSCWRGPDGFDIETTEPQMPVIHAFPYVFVERLNNRKLRQAMGKFINEQELEAKQKTVEQGKRNLNEKPVEKIPVDTAATASPAGETASPAATIEKAESAKPSEAEKEAFLDLLLDSDIVGGMLNSNISGVILMASMVDGASYRILDAEKKGNVFYLHSQIVFPQSGTRPKVYLERESICIGDNEDTIIIQTSAPSTDQRPAEATWINGFIAGLRVVSR